MLIWRHLQGFVWALLFRSVGFGRAIVQLYCIHWHLYLLVDILLQFVAILVLSSSQMDTYVTLPVFVCLYNIGTDLKSHSPYSPITCLVWRAQRPSKPASMLSGYILQWFINVACVGLIWPSCAENWVPNDVIKWKHFPRYWPFVRWIHWWPVDYPHKVHIPGALMFSIICAGKNGSANNRDAGDLRCHRAQYVVTVIWKRR